MDTQPPARSSAFTDAERALIDETLRFVAERTWRLDDNDFFYGLVNYLGQSLNVAYAFCDMIDPADDSVVETLALYAHGEITANIRYGLKGTPCENVIGRSLCCYVDKVQQTFPDDHLLSDLDAESYAGIPLWAADGSPLGLVAIMDTVPLRQVDLIKTVLQIVAVRAGAELERMQVLDRLRLSEQRFRDFAEASGDWLWEMGPDLRFTYFSDRVEEVTGVPAQFHIGKSRQDLAGEDLVSAHWRRHIDDLAHRRPFKDFQYLRRGHGGTMHYLSASGVPVFDRDGTFQGYRGVGTDITARKNAETALHTAKLEAESADRAKSDFLSLMSHELRTPLNAIFGFAQMLVIEAFGKHGDPRYRDYAQDIQTSSQHLLEIVNDILDLSKVEAGEIECNPMEMDLRSALEECANLVTGGGDPARISIEMGEPALGLHADHRIFRQVIINLLSNADKFTPPEGRIRVSAETRMDGSIRVEISDNGIGIAEKDIPRILEPFGQARPHAEVAHEGTGLGLSLASKLMQIQGGSLDIHSEPNVGTTVMLSFPSGPAVGGA